MYAFEPPLEPYYDYWNEYGKRKFIEEKIQEICQSIADKGTNSTFQEIYDFLYEKIEDSIEKYLPEASYE